MNNIHTIQIPASYTKENGVFVLHTTDLPLPDEFNSREPSYVCLPAGTFGGNHSHPRQEAFICYQPGVELHWLDSVGKKHISTFSNPDGSPILLIVPPHVPHAVINNSSTTITLIEYADGPLVDVKREQVLE